MSGIRPGHRSLIVLLAALALVTVNGDSASAGHEQTPSGEIVFVRGGHLYVASADGRGVTRLARDATNPAVSRDGRIAFVRGESIWVMRRDGSAQTRITMGHRDATPTWSPDGRTIYFSRFEEGKDAQYGYVYAWALIRMEPDGSGLRQLTRPSSSDHGVCHDSPSVSPDGRVVAYAYFGECDHGFGIVVEAIDPTGKAVSLTEYDDEIRNGFDPAWAPAGRRIAVATLGDEEQSIGIAVGSPRSPARRIYKRAATDPAWSPDGSWLAFIRGVSSGTIWLVRSDGTGLRRFSSRRYDADPAWLPATR